MRKYLKSFPLFKAYINSPYCNSYIRDFALKATLHDVYNELKTLIKYCQNDDFIIFKLQYLLKRQETNEIANTILFACLMGESCCTGCPYKNCNFKTGNPKKFEEITEMTKELL